MTHSRYGYRLPPDVVAGIRQAKTEGQSLSNIAKTFHCAKSTASLYCRDLFDYPNRLYMSEEEARKAILNRSLLNPDRNRGKYPRTLYQCSQCGKPVRQKGGTCISCYKIQRRQQALDSLIKRSAERQALKEQREQRGLERLRRFRPIKVDPCPNSPNKRHHWVIDSSNQGICKYCGCTKEFGDESVKKTKSRKPRTIESFPIAPWKLKYEANSVREALRIIARNNGGIIRVYGTAKLLVAAGIARGKPSSAVSYVYQTIYRSGEWDKVAPGTFKLKDSLR